MTFIISLTDHSYVNDEVMAYNCGHLVFIYKCTCLRKNVHLGQQVNLADISLKIYIFCIIKSLEMTIDKWSFEYVNERLVVMGLKCK